MAVIIADWLENAMADAKRSHARGGESELGKSRGDVSMPTPGRFVPDEQPRFGYQPGSMPRPNVAY